MPWPGTALAPLEAGILGGVRTFATPLFLLQHFLVCSLPVSLDPQSLFTLQSVCSFPSWAQQELWKLFSSLFLQWLELETPTPTSIVYISFPQVTSNPKRPAFMHIPHFCHHPVLLALSLKGVCVSKNFPAVRLPIRNWDDCIWDSSSSC